MAFLENPSNLYLDGTRAIAENYHLQGVNRFELIAGTRVSANETMERISATVLVFQELQARLGPDFKPRLRLTFIRDDSGRCVNIRHKTLCEVLTCLSKDDRRLRWISGFDFCGAECGKITSQVQELIETIATWRMHHLRDRAHTVAISVHAGEDVINVSAARQIRQFHQLLSLPIDRIAHGTFLWVPDEYQMFPESSNTERKTLLQKFVEKGCTFEICPTANKILSPLLKHRTVSTTRLDLFGAKYSINTDNSLIFSTDVAQEIASVQP
jgi:adenosine deaminase